MSEQSKARDYLQKRLEMLLDKKVILSAKISKINTDIENIDEMIKQVSKEVDNAFEIFSPRQKKNDFARLEIDKLLSNKQELQDSLTLLIEEANELDGDIGNIKEALGETIEDESVLCTDEEIISCEDRMNGIKILQQQENERSRIARDLHDSVVQVLANMIHKCEMCSKIIDVDSIRAKLELEIMSKNLRDSISEIRNIIYNLRPMSFDDLGLNTTLESLVNDIKSRTNMEVRFNVEGEKSELSNIIQLTIFRIVQECTNNCLKHSKGNNIDILLRYDEKNIYVKVSDDGVGMGCENVDNNKLTGFGLDMMKERVELLNGTIDISTEEEKGTTIEVNIPVL